MNYGHYLPILSFVPWIHNFFNLRQHTIMLLNYLCVGHLSLHCPRERKQIFQYTVAGCNGYLFSSSQNILRTNQGLFNVNEITSFSVKVVRYSTENKSK